MRGPQLHDKIIPSTASQTTRSVGQQKALCFIYGTFPRQAKYFLKTKLGPIYGRGHGNAKTPFVCALISSRLFDAHSALANSAIFLSPGHTFKLKIFMIGFVEESEACVQDFANRSTQKKSLGVLRGHLTIG
jgi:hypothetical protein